jgi:hypothetical protein
MFWTLELISKLNDAPFPTTKKELIIYAERCVASDKVIENLEMLEENDDMIYLSLQDIWPDMPLNIEDHLFNQDEY